MCGIMAYVGNQQAFPILIDGLKKLEYRGYDSAGVAMFDGDLNLIKRKGKVEDLIAFSESKNRQGTIGMGHTRWATHGVANHVNAHPHQSQSKRLTMVHNGIIENHEPLKSMLLFHGFSFVSNTDSEVLVQLIEWYQVRYRLSVREAMSRALQDIEGSFAIVLHDITCPEKIFVARRQSPLVIGYSQSGYVVSSDTMTFSKRVERVAYLEEDVIAELESNNDAFFISLDGLPIDQDTIEFDHANYMVSKGEYESFTLKEIFEQDISISKTIKRYYNHDRFLLSNVEPLLKDINRIIFVACGTSWHSGLVAEYLIEKYARISVEVEYASEFRYKANTLMHGDLVIGISQSGETADTISALEIAKSKGVKTIAIVNGVRSTIARMVDEVIYLDAGMEIGVASTKAFTSQLSAIIILTITLAKLRMTLSVNELQQMTEELFKLPQYVAETLASTERVVKGIAYDICDSSSALFLGRGISYPIAIEGALKLKEISYIHAEGYPAGEMKHGPIALVEQYLPIIALISDDDTSAKMISNIQEVKARRGTIIAIKNQAVNLSSDMADHVINIPTVPFYLNPVIQSIPLQLLSYYVAKLKGCNIDQPRNLAKSVTVE